MNDKQWKNQLAPKFKKEEKSLRFALSFIYIIGIIALISFFYTSYQKDSYVACFIISLGIIYSIVKLLSLQTSLYNKIHKSKKIIPIGNDKNLKNVLTIISKTETPVGLPKVGVIGNIALSTPTYILKNFGIVIYFYIRKGNIILKGKRVMRINNPAFDKVAKSALKLYMDDISNMFTLIVNKQTALSKEDIEKLFKNTESLNKI